MCMGRTNSDIDDELIRRVQFGYGLRTKREAVDFALRRLLVEPFNADGTRWPPRAAHGTAIWTSCARGRRGS